MKPGYINLRVMRVDQVTQPHTKCYERLSDQQCVSKHCEWYERATRYLTLVQCKLQVCVPFSRVGVE